MTAIVTHYLIFVSLMFLATEKFKIDEMLMQSKYKLLYRLGKCEFCFSFWVALLATLIVDLITFDFGRQDFIMPLVIVGLHIVVTKLNYENE